MFADLSGVVDRLDIPPGPLALTHLLAITDRLQARVSAAVGELDASGDYGLDGAISAQACASRGSIASTSKVTQ